MTQNSVVGNESKLHFAVFQRDLKRTNQIKFSKGGQNHLLGNIVLALKKCILIISN